MIKGAVRFIRKGGRIIPVKAKGASKAIKSGANAIKNDVKEVVKKNKPRSLVEWGVMGSGALVGASILSSKRKRKDRK